MILSTFSSVCWSSLSSFVKELFKYCAVGKTVLLYYYGSSRVQSIDFWPKWNSMEKKMFSPQIDLKQWNFNSAHLRWIIDLNVKIKNDKTPRRKQEGISMTSEEAKSPWRRHEKQSLSCRNSGPGLDLPCASPQTPPIGRHGTCPGVLHMGPWGLGRGLWLTMGTVSCTLNTPSKDLLECLIWSHRIPHNKERHESASGGRFPLINVVFTH